jgi:hypothetical protein
MVLLIEFLVAVGLVAIIGSVFFTGYKVGKEDKKEEK